MSVKPTPLELALAERTSVRATPLTAFRLARSWWLEGKRLNLSALADELGVGRATLMRWVGNKELLLGEILWSLYKELFDEAKEQADTQKQLKGADYLVSIYHQVNQSISDSEPLHQFLRHDPKFGLQVLTSNVSGLQSRLIEVWKQLIEVEIEAGTLAPQMDSESLAYFIIRIGEAAIYSDLICGREPELEPADTALRLLLTARL